MYTYPLALGPPPSPHPTHLGHHRALHWAPCALRQVPISYLLYTRHCIHVSPNSSCPPLTLPCPHVHFLCLHLCFCPANSFIYSIFLDSMFMCCSTIYSSQDVEATQMSINLWMDKEEVIRACNGILVSHKKERNWVICRGMSGPGVCPAE